MPVTFRTRSTGAVLCTAALALGCSAPRVVQVVPATPRTRVGWPAAGQASFSFAGAEASSPGQQPVPIASVAKLMTAYLVVHRMSPQDRLVVHEADVADTRRRAARGESLVRVERGEVLSRDQALTALLLPSANNIAAMLAVRVSGSRSAFLALMNRTAHVLSMESTRYTDPSGYAPSTVSTAHDQLLLLTAALRSATLLRITGTRSAVLPVAGRVESTNSLLGRYGVVAGKTGSTSAAGGCLVFRVVRDGRVLDAVVLGQQGGSLLDAASRAAVDLTDQVLRSS